MPLTPRTTGAWLIGQSMKLRTVNSNTQFAGIEQAGTAGTLLSILAGTNEDRIPEKRLTTLAGANGITVLTLRGVLPILEQRHVISRSKSGEIAVLGLTQGTVLEKTTEIFNELQPDAEDRAVLEISELVSNAPVKTADLTTFVSDTFKLDKVRTKDLLQTAEDIGFVDAEGIDADNREKLYFNGNVFRIKDARKTEKVLASLTAADQQKMKEFDDVLGTKGYATLEQARQIIGEKLFEKLQAIAIYDVNRVANSEETTFYVTKPGAFAKFGNPWEEDTLDFAKELVSCLAYGMTRSTRSRGRIESINKLINIVNVLIRGEWLGANTAAGEDYKSLELKNVLQTKVGSRYGHHMRLLKREVGIVALEVLTKGVGSSESVIEKVLPSAPATKFSGPEVNRTEVRKKKTVSTPDRKLVEMLYSVRTGGI